MPDSKRLSGIYAILPADLELDELLSRAGSAMQGGIRILQLRDKKQGYKKHLKRALAMRELTTCFDARLIINDSVQLAMDADADGVHLGRNEMQNLRELRENSGRLLLGVSCQADAAFAHHVLNDGANYVSFGAIFPTSSKEEAVPIGLPRLAKARAMFPEANICAIGGITQETLPMVRRAGADCAAVIASLFNNQDIEHTAHMMVDTWNNALSA